jgi:hypothetical protein
MPTCADRAKSPDVDEGQQSTRPIIFSDGGMQSALGRKAERSPRSMDRGHQQVKIKPTLVFLFFLLLRWGSLRISARWQMRHGTTVRVFRALGTLLADRLRPIGILGQARDRGETKRPKVGKFRLPLNTAGGTGLKCIRCGSFGCCWHAKIAREYYPQG